MVKCFGERGQSLCWQGWQDICCTIVVVVSLSWREGPLFKSCTSDSQKAAIEARGKVSTIHRKVSQVSRANTIKQKPWITGPWLTEEQVDGLPFERLLCTSSSTKHYYGPLCSANATSQGKASKVRLLGC